MRILFLSFYYPPDLCAGSFRTVALIQAIQHQLSADSHIDMLTTMPNRYSSFSVGAPEVEEGEQLSIRRVTLPLHKSGILDQAKAFLAYAREVRAHVRSRKYDLVFATSSRLMTAVLGASIARSQRVPLYLDVRDIFVDTANDILPNWLAWPTGFVFSILEHYAIGYASKVNLVSRGFEDYFSSRYPQRHFSFFSNGIDDEFLVPTSATAIEIQAVKPPYSILYAGNLGEGQGLHSILPGLAKALQGQANFIIIGDGGRKTQLSSALADANVNNVALHDPVNRSALAIAYQSADILFLHLNDYEAFKKVLPSKVFEYAATGKPILAGVAGYAAEFIKKEIDNAQIFSPCDVDGAVHAFANLQMRKVWRGEFISKFGRRSIMQALAMDIILVGQGGRL